MREDGTVDSREISLSAFCCDLGSRQLSGPDEPTSETRAAQIGSG